MMHLTQLFLIDLENAVPYDANIEDLSQPNLA